MKDRSGIRSKTGIAISMVIFGTIGIFRRYIDMPSAMLACLRGIIGGAFLSFLLLFKGKKADNSAVRKNLFLLCLSGALIGINWIMMFEAYRFTSVSVATLCYYMAPVFVILASAVLFRERITVMKACCIAAAVIGMVLVSGADLRGGSAKGVLLGLSAAVLYATVVILNKKIQNVPPYEKTIVQLLSAGLVLVPYVLIAESPHGMTLSGKTIVLVLIVAILHTGISYAIYFGSIEKLRMQTVALFSYIDPVVAVLLSALILKERIGVSGWIGAALILGATFLNEYLDGRQRPAE